MSTMPLPMRRRVGRRLRIRPRGRRLDVLSTIAVTIVALALLAAVFGPALAPYDPNELNFSRAFVGPFGGHWLGFDSQGRDLFSRLLAGARTSVFGPLFVIVVATIVGTFLAITAAWRGGRVDTAISALVDLLFAFPAILLGVLAAAIFGGGLTAATLALAVAYTPYFARILRGAATTERHRDYVAALEVQGASASSICLRHLLPNLGRMIVAEATIMFAWAMLDLSALSFLGLGVQPPQSDWGVMVEEGKQGVLQGYPAEALAAGAAIVLLVVAVNFLGERMAERALREPR